MKRIIILILGLILLSQTGKAQLIPLNIEYAFNPYLSNPSYAGLVKTTSANFTSRSQWIGFDDAPRIQTFSLDTRIKAKGKYNHSGKVIRKSRIPRSGNVGVGLSVTNDINEPFKRTGVQLSYAYHLGLNNGDAGFLSLGLSGMLYQQKIDGGSFQNMDFYDPTIDLIENRIVPNLGFGALYQINGLNIGISGLHLLPATLQHLNVGDGEQVLQQWYGHISYELTINDKILYEPMVFLTNTPNAVQIRNRLLIDNSLETTLSWITTKTVFVLLAYRLKHYKIGYAFEFSHGDIQTYNHGSHTIYLNFQF